VEHWAEGGGTRLGNLLLLCAFHHRKVHEGGWKALYNEKDDTALFFGPKGVLRYTRRGVGKRDGGGGRRGNGRGDGVVNGDYAADANGGKGDGHPPGSASRLIEANRARGITPDGWTPTARAHAWGLDSMDLELRASEVLDGDTTDQDGA
jgi:hypothetical protein